MRRTNTTQPATTNAAFIMIVIGLLTLALAACGGDVGGEGDDLAPTPSSTEIGKPDAPDSKQPGLGGNGAPLPADSLVYACIRSTACGVKPYPRVSNCVAYYSDMLVTLGKAPLYDTIYGCANQAQSCSALETCFGVTNVCNGSFQASCQGGKAVFCDLLDKTTFAYDCKAAGMGCQLDAQYGFAAKCVPTASAAAPAAPAQGTMKSTVDCADGRCAKTGQACSENDLNRCAGDSMEACLDGQWVRFDCDKLNLSACTTHTGGWASCGEIL